MSAPLWLLLIGLTYTLFLGATQASSLDEQKVYIVYMGDLPKNGLSAISVHNNILQQVVGSRASESLLYSYKRSFSGFVARLTKEEKNKIASMEGVVSVFLNRNNQLHTTRSWDFIGFPQQAQRTPLESDIIIGMLDTGVWPESDSFSDEGFGPPPSKWKGSCQSANFTCNKKLIGAKYFNTGASSSANDDDSARDTEGHGTHTASTAAGRAVNNASLLGLGSGIARGGVPSARIAVYKICWAFGCASADILAAFDEAIADGVDIISLSVGSSFPSDYFEDPIAIGAFHSMKNGILTSNSAGNSGPSAQSVANFSPWSLTVAASTIDRKFLAKVQLGNNKSYEGLAINTFDLKHSSNPFVYGGDVPNTKEGFTSAESSFCEDGSLDPTLVNGTIVLCDTIIDGTSVLEAGAIGTVMNGDVYNDFGFTFPLAASYVSTKEGSEINKYINSTSNATATIFKSTAVKEELAPFVVSFSSRGPNPITSDILKPDLTAPGVDILAAWSEGTTVTGDIGDTRVVPFNIISGTSMSCPHASGAAAYVKSFHPLWSPAAIKSALMTTATVMNVTENEDAEFAYGSGQINPLKAVSPGLVYDAGEADYANFLCGQGYNTSKLRIVTGDSSSCSAAKNLTVWDLNYPSFALSTTSSSSFTRTFNRTVTNVGYSNSTYKSTVSVPAGLSVEVSPSVLSFTSTGQKLSFTVSVTATVASTTLSGSLVWDDEVSQVRSPIVAYQAI